MRKTTNVDLVDILVARNKDGNYDLIINEARDGEYHDYKNNKYTCGKVQLVYELDKFPELKDIREAVINGEYDEEPDEQDKADMKSDLIKNMGLEKAQKVMEALKLK